MYRKELKRDLAELQARTRERLEFIRRTDFKVYTKDARTGAFHDITTEHLRELERDLADYERLLDLVIASEGEKHAE